MKFAVVSKNLLCNLAWHTVFMTRLVLLISYSLNIWNELQKRECRTVDHYFETVPHCLNVAILSLFCRYAFGRCSSELAELFLLPYLRGRSTRYFNRLHDFSVFPLTYYRNGFKRDNAQVFVFFWLLLFKINAAIFEVIKTKYSLFCAIV